LGKSFSGTLRGDFGGTGGGSLGGTSGGSSDDVEECIDGSTAEARDAADGA